MKVKALTYNQLQTLCWTEDNRLQAVKDIQMGAYYNYDASGERNLKLTGAVVHMSQNGVPYDYVMLESPTLYASGLITINERGYTKHYFEENKRVCSNIGGGFRDAGYDITEPIGLITSFEEQLGNAKDGIFNTFEQCIKSPVDLENTKDKIVNVMKDHEKDRNEEEYQFYYTSDHLGSSSYITDESGAVTQTLAYLPYGESWVDLDNTPPYLTPYKFNGKEKDEETGYNNYGARYYYDWASIWLSVDPLSDKYPHLTNYVYCSNNPVMVVDPNGEDEWDIDMKTGEVKQTQAEGKEIVRLNKNGETLSNMTFEEGSIAFTRNKEYITDDEEGPLTNTMLTFKKSEDARKVFNTIVSFDGDKSKESDVEWDFLAGVKNNFSESQSGYLQTSGRKDKIASKGFNIKNVTEWRHYHPSSNSESYVVSRSDYDNSQKWNIPSYLHFKGREVRFDIWPRYKGISKQRENHYR